MPYRFTGLAFALGIAIALTVVYWAGLAGGFFFDDSPNLLVVPGLRMDKLTWDAVMQAWDSGTAGPLGRPFAMLTFALNYYGQGFDPFAFKLTNLLIHALCGILIYVLAHELLKTNSFAGRVTAQTSKRAATVVAAFWLLHPIQLLAVLYVVQRMTSLAALFLLAAFYLHIWGRSNHGSRALVALAASWLVLWPLSILSKETGVIFPVFVLAWELLIRWHAARQLDRFALLFIAAAVVAVGTIAIYTLGPSSAWLWSGYAMRDFTLIDRLYTEGRVLWFYIGLILFPRLGAFGLYHDDLALSTSLLSPWTTLPSLIGLIAIVVAIILLRKCSPLVAFGLAWFLIGHSLESTVLPLEIAHEHRNYLPLFGLLLAAAHRISIVFEAKMQARVPITKLILAALLGCVVVTALRAYQFGEAVRRTQMEAQNHPASARAQYEAGTTLLGTTSPTASAIALARRHFEIANTVDPNFKPAVLGIIQLNCALMHSAGSLEIDNLAQRLGSTPFGPGDRNILYNVKEQMNNGALCLTRAEVDLIFNASLSNPTVSAGVAAILHSWHADYLWINQRDMPAARDALEVSLKLHPKESSNSLKLAQLMFISGEYAAANKALLALSRENLSLEERNTMGELLAAINIKSP